MKKQIKNTEKIVLLLMTISATIITALGITYAYFTADITGNETSTTVFLTGGKLTIQYASNDVIDVSNIYPSNDAIDEKVFTVTGRNNTELSMPYWIELHIIKNSFQTGAISYELTGTGDVYSADDKYVPSATGTLDNYELGGINKVSVAGGSFGMSNSREEDGTGTATVHTYTLALYFLDTNTVQNENQGKELKAYVYISDEDPNSE